MDLSVEFRWPIISTLGCKCPMRFSASSTSRWDLEAPDFSGVLDAKDIIYAPLPLVPVSLATTWDRRGDRNTGYSPPARFIAVFPTSSVYDGRP